MAVNWYWNNKCGELTMKNSQQNKKYKINLYAGSNCMMVLLYEYHDEETNKDMYQFQGFWDDIDHLKRCMNVNSKGIYVGDEDNIYEDAVKLKINIAKAPRECYKIVELFAKYTKAKVEVYYKEDKKK